MEDDSHIIFERNKNDEQVPEGFTAATYKLDVSPSSNLAWQLPNDPFPLLLDLDFGLFSPTWKGFSHQGFFQTCQFAIKELLPLLQQTLGCIIGRLELPFRKYVPWTDDIQESFEVWKKTHALHDKELFCRDLVVDYLTLLTAPIPSNKLRCIVLDAQAAQDPLSFYQCTQKDAFGPCTLAIQNAPFPTDCTPIGRTILKSDNPAIAFLLPSYNKATREYYDAMREHINKNISFKVIVEDFLTSEWDGIDELIITDAPYCETTKRALDGFQASGGVVKKAAMGLW